MKDEGKGGVADAMRKKGRDVVEEECRARSSPAGR